ncbi:MAG: hypothetical protein V2I25_15380 [Woeseiaceae bacterium]|nr:hypothetical protein [Woeseiaceae bacterium]
MMLLLVAAGGATAQTTDTDAEPGEEAPVIDEIVVTAQKPGDRRRLEMSYEDLMRQRLVEELDTMRREQEEIEWRRGPRIENPSRISFGYRPQERAREAPETPMTDLPVEYNKPATIFRFEFGRSGSDR